MHHFPGQRSRIPTARLGLRVSERPFAQGRFSISSAISPLPLATCWFSCLAAPPIDCFTNKLAQSAQTVFAKQSLCSPIRRKSAKGLPSEAEISHFDYGKLSICANGPFYFIGSAFCWTIYQTKERVKFDVFFKICIIYKNIGVFFMTCAHLGEIPLHRHLEKFSQIFRA